MRDWYPHLYSRRKSGNLYAAECAALFIFGMFHGYEEETVKIFMKLVINNFCKVVI